MRSSGCAYLTFTSPDAASECIRAHALPGDLPERQQLHAALGGAHWKLKRAPEPEDIIWSNHGVGGCQRVLRVLFINLAILFALAFVVSPATVSDYLLQLVANMGIVGSTLAQFVPVLVIFLFLWTLVPLLLHLASHHEGQVLYSDLEDSYMKKSVDCDLLEAVDCGVCAGTLRICLWPR